MGLGRLRFAGKIQFYSDDVLDLQEKVTGIFDAPVGVGNVKFPSSLPAAAVQVGVNRDDKFMIRAMNRKYSVQLDVGGP